MTNSTLSFVILPQLDSEGLDAVIFTFDSGFVNRGYSVIPRMRV